LAAAATETQGEKEVTLNRQEQEAAGWAAYEALCTRCKEIAVRVWGADLDAAVEAQQKLAEQMRDRTVPRIEGEMTWRVSGELHVPCFTPRDRLQFIKEAAATYLIGTEKRGLTVTPEDAPVPDPVVPFGKQKGTPLTSLSTDDLEEKLAWCLERQDRAAKFADFMVCVENELQARKAKADAIQTQDLREYPLALAGSEEP
jgi:hypothetical protein